MFFPKTFALFTLVFCWNILPILSTFNFNPNTDIDYWFCYWVFAPGVYDCRIINYEQFVNIAEFLKKHFDLERHTQIWIGGYTFADFHTIFEPDVRTFLASHQHYNVIVVDWHRAYSRLYRPMLKELFPVIKI